MESFYNYSKDWWNTYKKKTAQQHFDKRLIKIYAETEDNLFIPVFSFITPLYNLNGIDTPYHAARFVSLIPLIKSEKTLTKKKEIWTKFFTLLVRKGGDVQDHCTFLCSMLLGFGLDAYVILGTNFTG